VKALQRTLAIIAFLVLAAQTVRHAYLLWLEPRASVLDQYDQPLKDKIAGAASVDELLRRYDLARKEVEQAKKEQPRTAEQYGVFESEPYRSEHQLREAITNWEAGSKEIHALRFYWLTGLVFLILGVLIYRKLNRWFGVTLLIVAFSELIYWTSPTFLGPATREFDRLLANKFVFSAVSLVLLIAVIWFQRIFADEDRRSV
jgi:hypothetical protein